MAKAPPVFNLMLPVSDAIPSHLSGQARTNDRKLTSRGVFFAAAVLLMNNDYTPAKLSFAFADVPGLLAESEASSAPPTSVREKKLTIVSCFSNDDLFDSNSNVRNSHHRLPPCAMPSCENGIFAPYI
jgi:hypothetical protein